MQETYLSIASWSGHFQRRAPRSLDPVFTGDNLHLRGAKGYALKEILGSHNDDDAFEVFLRHWREVAERRIAQAVGVISSVDGVAGLILAGSHGAGNPWPLSDIDLLPIYRDDKADEAIEAVERHRLAMLDEWSTQGWRTGLDIGRLRFTTGELRQAFLATDPDPVTLLTDERWYHSIDKGFGQLLKAVQWRQIHLMEGWGERDNSLGQFGTRFELTATDHDEESLVANLNALSGLDEKTARERIDRAPRWVIERRDRSWASRQHIGEQVTALQNDQDVLRVSTMYELRTFTGPPFPLWLGIPESDDDLLQRVRLLTELMSFRNGR